MQTVNVPVLLYREVQRFRQPWLWAVIALIAGLQWWGFIQQILLHRPFGDHPEPDWMCVLFVLIFGLGLPWLLYSCRLDTRVYSDALYVQLFPFHLRPVRIEYDTLAEHMAVKYNPLLDYGGWGIRYAGRAGRAYNVSGNLGVRLEFVSSRPLLIGSQHPVELAGVITLARHMQDA